MQRLPGSNLLLAVLAFSIGVELGDQLLVLPLSGALKVARRSSSTPAAIQQGSLRLLWIGSAVISLAGVYLLCVALSGRPQRCRGTTLARTESARFPKLVPALRK